MRQMGSVQPSFIRLFLDDKQAPCVQRALAARGIGALRERNPSTGPPLDGGSIRAWRALACARPFVFGMTLPAKVQSEKLIGSSL